MILLTGLVFTIALGTSSGSTTLFNNTKVKAYGLRVVFDRPVTIVKTGKGFSNYLKLQDGKVIIFTEGIIPIWGDFYFFWTPVKANIISYNWLNEPYSHKGTESASRLSKPISELTHKGFSLEYKIDLTQPNTHTVRVTLNIYTKYITTLDLSLSNYHSGARLVPPEDVIFSSKPSSGFSAWEKKWNGPGGELPLWHFSFQAGSTITVAYKRTFKTQAGDRFHGVTGYLSNEYFLTTGEKYLIIPQIIVGDKPRSTYANLLQGIRVNYILPDSWEIWTPWEKLRNSTFNPYIYTGPTAAYTNLVGLALSTVIAGPKDEFSIHNKTLGGTEVVFVFSSDIRNIDEKASKLFQAFEMVQTLWGESIDNKYLAAFSSKMRVYSGEWTNSQGFSENQGNPGIVGEMFIHQVFHRWNGWLPFAAHFDEGKYEANKMFYQDGWNEYYCDKILNKLGIFNKKWHFLKSWYSKYKMEYKETSRDISVGRVAQSGLKYGNSDFVFITYRKGALVAYMLDHEIKVNTNGAYSLDNVVKKIWSRYGHRKATFNYYDILQIINQLTGKDFSNFFENYVFGNKPLEIPELE